MRYGLVFLVLSLFGNGAASAEVRWGLDFKVDRVGTAVVNGVQGWGNYLYLVATVSNANGREVPLSLGVDGTTDVVGRHYRGGYDPIVARYIEQRFGLKLKSLFEVRGRIADGASEQILVTFGKLDPNVDRCTMLVEGLRDRVYSDKYQEWVEDSILQLNFERLGDEFLRQDDLVRFKGSQWVSEPRTALKRSGVKKK